MAVYEFTCERCGKERRVYRADHQPRPRFCSRVCMRNRPEDLWDYVDRSGGPDACWPFTGARDKDGYGKFCANYVRQPAHRVAYELTYGPISDGVLIRHRICDNPPCCNPSHLAPGSEADNSADMVARNRAASGDRNASRAHPERLVRGEQHPNARLSDALVREIHRAAANGETGAAIARRIGVSKKTVCLVIRGNAWQHVVNSRS